MKKTTLIGVLFLCSFMSLGQQREINRNIDLIVSEMISVTVNLSPNPAFDYIGFNLDISIKVSVFNQQGEEVIPVTEIAPQELLDIAHLTAGTYLVKMDTGTEVITWKFVKN